MTEYAAVTTTSGLQTATGDVTDETLSTAAYANTTNSSGFGQPSLTPFNFTEYLVARRMYGVYPIITATIGTVGNVISLVVLLRKKLRRSSPCAYMAALAITDTMVLWSTLFGMLSVVYFPSMTSPGFCKSLNYFTTVSTQMSAWLIVAMTIERFIVVYFPFKSGKFCTVKNARITIVTLALFFIVLSIHEFITTYYIPTRRACDHDVKTYALFLEVYNYVDASLSCLVPELLLFTFNSLIVHKIRRSASIRKDMVGGGAAIDTAKQSKQVTVMLLAVSFTFCLLLTPYALFYISTIYWVDYRNPAVYARAALTQQSCIFLIMINHSVNFILYFVSGRKFRTELRRIICCFCMEEEKDPRSMYTMRTTNTTMSKSAMSVTELSSV